LGFHFHHRLHAALLEGLVAHEDQQGDDDGGHDEDDDDQNCGKYPGSSHTSLLLHLWDWGIGVFGGT
jgi:hypothetical protein